MNKRVLYVGLAALLLISGTTYAVNKLYKGNPYKPDVAQNVAAGYGGCPCRGGSGSAVSPGQGGVPAPSKNDPAANQAPAAVSGQGFNPAPSSGERVEDAKRRALDYYVNKYNDKNVTIDVKDFGCHMEAYVNKGGKMVKKLVISGGNIFEAD